MATPLPYDPETGDQICERLIAGKDGSGPESLRSICRDEEMPSLSTVMRWLRTSGEFKQQYADAREAQSEFQHEEILEIADNATDDIIFLTAEDASGDGAKPAIKHSAINRARLQIDTRKWIMARMAPKKYGDKVQTEHSGGITVSTKEQRDAAVAAALDADK